MIAWPVAALQPIVTSVIELIKQREAFDTKMFDALPPADKVKAAQEHYASISLLHEHRRNFHAVLIWIFELIGGKALVEARPIDPAKPSTDDRKD